MIHKDSLGRPLFTLMVRCVIKKDNKFLLVFEKGENVWETPGGTLETREYIEDGLLREAQEETGHKIKLIKPIVAQIGSSHRVKDEKIVCIIFEAKLVKKVKQPEPNVIGIKWFNRKEIKNLKPDWHDEKIFEMITNNKI